MEYIIVKNNGFGAPLSYFCSDSFWQLRNHATKFQTREAAEAHCVVLSKPYGKKKGNDLASLNVVAA